MKHHALMIVETVENQWTAWLGGIPQIAFVGERTANAIKRLLAHSGTHKFEEHKIWAVDERTRDGHLEFMIPMRGQRRIPSPSVN